MATLFSRVRGMAKCRYNQAKHRRALKWAHSSIGAICSKSKRATNIRCPADRI
jgi:hypothetical protein